MEYYVERTIIIAWDVLRTILPNLDWMAWNLFLAFIPLLLAMRLFRRPAADTGGLRWWVGVVAFFAFLPNAPYVLTDLIHLWDDIHTASTEWRAAFAIIPLYVAFCAAGFAAYVVSLIWLTRFLRFRGWGERRLVGVEFTTHLACAFGIYLGRFVRLNTWDLVARPTDVAASTMYSLAHVPALAFVAVFFIATSVLYWPAKHVIIATVAYVRSGGMRASASVAARYM